MAFSHSHEIYVEFSGDDKIDGLIAGDKWENPEIFYSDPDSRADFGDRYMYDYDRDGIFVLDEPGFGQISNLQLRSVHLGLNTASLSRYEAAQAFTVSGFTELELTYAGSGSTEAEIRVTRSSDYSGGYAFYPDDNEEGGDVWLSDLDPQIGNDDHLIVLHELGHALGLKHGHQKGYSDRLPAQVDSNEFSIMTYRTFIGGGTEDEDVGAYEEWGAPQTFMSLDVAALQYLYGANFETNAGDTVYRWSPDSGNTMIDGEDALEPGENRIFATIWDGGGIDTYNLSDYDTAVSINLRPGYWSVFSEDQLSYLGGGPNDGFARGNIFNALQYADDPRSLIENARGGSAGDWLRGNAADNTLQGKGGDDSLRGGIGADTLIGGKGNDIFVFLNTKSSRTTDFDTIMRGDGSRAFKKPGDGKGDLIDLSKIDADWGTAGDQAFEFGKQAGKGRLWAENRGSDTYIFGNTDDDAAAELKIVIADGSNRASDYTANDFIL